jgi:hypothetical protein
MLLCDVRLVQSGASEMSDAADKLNAKIAEIGAQAARIQSKGGGHRGGELQVRGRQEPTAVDNLNARIAEIGAETARIQANSAECLWICWREKPPLLPDPELPTIETNPLRRANVVSGQVTTAPSGVETKLDYSAARPPANSRGR